MDLMSDMASEAVKMPHIFVDPIDASELKIIKAGIGKAVGELVEIPLASKLSVLNVVKVERASVNATPVFLVREGSRERYYNFMFEAGVSDFCFLMLDARVESVESLAFFKHAVEIALPVFLTRVAFTAITGSIVALGEIGKLEEKIAVEEPVFLTIGKFMHNVRLNLVFSPGDALATPLINQSEVADLVD